MSTTTKPTAADIVPGAVVRRSGMPDLHILSVYSDGSTYGQQRLSRGMGRVRWRPMEAVLFSAISVLPSAPPPEVKP